MRFIDADLLLDEIKEYTPITSNIELDNAVKMAHNVMYSMIAMAKTVDAAPVVHGKWLQKPLKKHPETNIDYCSICNHTSLGKYNYCPNCGAKLDL